MSGFEPKRRLERLWAGQFGDDYVERNADADRGREDFWNERIADLHPKSALEVGCNIGGNLRWLAAGIGGENVAGVDVNEEALRRVTEAIPGVDTRLAAAIDLPFEDSSFELVFTTGVLIHIGDEELVPAMREIVRCSSRWVLCGEYHADERTEVPYRGHDGALIKRDFGGLYQAEFPELELYDTGFLPRGQGSWDDVTWCVFEKPR